MGGQTNSFSSRLSKFNYNLIYPEYIGGVTLFNKEHFNWINGFSNKYWGWGFEDDDLLYRCRKGGVPLDQQWVDFLVNRLNLQLWMLWSSTERIIVKYH